MNENIDIMSMKIAEDIDMPEDLPNEKSEPSSNASDMQTAMKLFIGFMLDSLTSEMCRKFILKLLDSLEELAKKSKNNIDDIVVYSVTNRIRKLLNEEEKNKQQNTELNNFLNEQVDNITSAIDQNINIQAFRPDSSTKMFENISDAIKSNRFNPFEK